MEPEAELGFHRGEENDEKKEAPQALYLLQESPSIVLLPAPQKTKEAQEKISQTFSTQTCSSTDWCNRSDGPYRPYGSDGPNGIARFERFDGLPRHERRSR